MKVEFTSNLTTDIIKNNCNFDFDFNKTDVTPTVLDGGDEIVLVNWPNDKHIMCNVNNDIPVKIPSHPYVLGNRSVLCNCRIEADNHYLLESLAACDNKPNNLVMYFTINMAFTNYLAMLPNLTIPSLIRDRTTYEQPLPIYLTFPVLTAHCKVLLQTRKVSCTTMLSTKKFLILNKGMYPQLNP